MKPTHQDNRRELYDWANGDFKSCKVVYANEKCVVGDHYHKKKREEFFLASGSFDQITIGKTTRIHLFAPQRIIVPPDTYHKFTLAPGSILVGVATEAYDADDENQGEP